MQGSLCFLVNVFVGKMVILLAIPTLASACGVAKSGPLISTITLDVGILIALSYCCCFDA